MKTRVFPIIAPPPEILTAITGGGGGAIAYLAIKLAVYNGKHPKIIHEA